MAEFLKGKSIAVTGAGRGIGRAVAMACAAEGANVAVNYRSSDKEAETLVSEIMAKGGKAKSYKADVAVHRKDGAPYDYHRLLHTFRVKSRTKDVGIYRPAHRWAFSGPVSFRMKI